MEKNDVSDLKEIVREIEKNKILLPDFQRDFTWKDEDVQKNIICSLLAQLPIGSILLLESDPNEYSCKMLGTQNKPNICTSEKVKFLLDGQQRLTVLCNVFSNVIFDNCKNFADLVSPSLKRRFFLKIPNWDSYYNEKTEHSDLFGIKKLKFPIENPDSDDPNFLVEDIKPFVEIKQFKVDDKTPYNPKEKLSINLDSFCLNDKDYYLIPLFLLAPTDKSNKQQISIRYNTILKNISQKVKDEIIAHYIDLNDDDKINFLKEFDYGELGDKKFEEELSDRAEFWKDNLDKYLSACIQKILLNKIVVSEKQRARAIDIYENLNKGGIRLSAFDLVVAKAAKSNSKNFYERICESIEKPKKYDTTVVPDYIKNIIDSKIVKGAYNASENVGCFNKEKKELSAVYRDTFLNVLSLYCNNPDLKSDNIKIDFFKRNKILELKSNDIDCNCEKVCIALDRAFFFLQTRCGIRSINEINYKHILTVIATVFLKDKNFTNRSIHDMLEAWYWACLFSGEYDKDQNDKVIKHLQAFSKTISGKQDASWIKSIKSFVLCAQNFSDKDLLLMKKAKDDRLPKDVIKNFICQFYLARTYPDMFDDKKTISVFFDDDNLEAHHIIPLGSAKNYNEGDKTDFLRNDHGNICNSPVNFVLITSKANKEISSDALDIYAKKIVDGAKAALNIQANFGNGNFDFTNELNIEQVLENRFDGLKGLIENRISNLI